jgi:hypothetical protein
MLRCRDVTILSAALRADESCAAMIAEEVSVADVRLQHVLALVPRNVPHLEHAGPGARQM